MHNAFLNSFLIGYKRAVTGVEKLKILALILCVHRTAVNGNLLPFHAVFSYSTKYLASNARVLCLYILHSLHIGSLYCGYAARSRRYLIRVTKPNATKTTAHAHTLHLGYFVTWIPEV
jgi:hypothetical protein